jgi:hypothetical protein
MGKPVNGGRVAQRMGGASRHQSCPLISYFMLVVSQRQYLKFKNMFHLITKEKYFYLLQLSILLQMRYVLMRYNRLLKFVLNEMRLFCPTNSLVVRRNLWLILLSKI